MVQRTWALFAFLALSVRASNDYAGLSGDIVNLLQTKVEHREAAERSTEEERCSLQHPAASSNLPKAFNNFKHGSFYSGLYVNKDHKFAFCLIEKNANSAWGTILNKLERFNLDAGYNDKLVQNSFSPEAAEEVFKNPSATRAVFVRDPLERFLSAFLDKCLSGTCVNDPSDFCYMRKPEQRGSGIPFSQAVEWMQTQNTSDWMEGHWNLQSHHCELNSRLNEYTVLGIMKKETLARNAACLLEGAGLGFLNVKSSDDSAPAFWQASDHAGATSETSELLKAFYTREAAEAVYNKLKEDYEVFKLPRPSWIDQAHGKFFSEVRPSKCSPMLLQIDAQVSRRQAILSNVLDEVDDIPRLADRAGFRI